MHFKHIANNWNFDELHCGASFNCYCLIQNGRDNNRYFNYYQYFDLHSVHTHTRLLRWMFLSSRHNQRIHIRWCCCQIFFLIFTVNHWLIESFLNSSHFHCMLTTICTSVCKLFLSVVYFDYAQRHMKYKWTKKRKEEKIKTIPTNNAIKINNE